MTFEGVLTKMTTEYATPINYYLIFSDNFIHVNQLLNKKIRFKYVKNECLSCHKDKPIFRQGFCKNCFFDIPQAAEWIMKPELSKAHLGQEDRDLEYEKKVQIKPHIVYLANSSNIKVGVTRKTQVPTRWIDQGAHEAIELIEAPNRYIAGITEVALKDFVADKTNWRTMLKNEIKDEDIVVWRDRLLDHIPDDAKEYILNLQQRTEIQFPVLQYPKKPKSLNFSKTATYEGVLKGIKGQYLIFEDDTVCNIRSNEGYVVRISID